MVLVTSSLVKTINQTLPRKSSKNVNLVKSNGSPDKVVGSFTNKRARLSYLFKSNLTLLFPVKEKTYTHKNISKGHPKSHGARKIKC